jgi:hypothetical protein
MTNKQGLFVQTYRLWAFAGMSGRVSQDERRMLWGLARDATASRQPARPSHQRLRDALFNPVANYFNLVYLIIVAG